MSTHESDGTRTKECPHCGRELLEKALKCRHCYRWMPADPAATVATSSHPLGSGELTPGQSPRHLVLLGIFTLGLYQFYWFYRNWRDLRDRTSADISPGWRTVGLLVPLLNVYLVYDQLRQVRDLAAGEGVVVSYAPGITTAAFFLLAATANLGAGAWVVSLLSIVPLVPPQQVLNELWERQQPGGRVREELAPYEIAMIAVGAMLTLSTLLATLS